MIPKGLPGAGNILIYDNGGWAGYGPPNPGAPTGTRNALRDHSRIMEFNPVTLKMVWEYKDCCTGSRGHRFYSGYISAAQRLPNGNTMITEGSNGRLFEVTPEKEIVWEYINVFFYDKPEYRQRTIYRAYRVPYKWVPQLKRPAEKAVIPPDMSKWRIKPQG